MTEVSRQYITLQQQVDIYEKLRVVGKKIGDHFAYCEPYSDQVLAEEFKCKDHHIKRIRVELFGEFPPKQKLTIEQRLTEIEDYLTRTNSGWRG